MDFGTFDSQLVQSVRLAPVSPRDAHWLEPFAFGAAAYLVVLAPRTLDLAVYAFLVGAIAGVFAAGASHFSPDRWKERTQGLILLVAFLIHPNHGVNFLFTTGNLNGNPVWYAFVLAMLRAKGDADAARDLDRLPSQWRWLGGCPQQLVGRHQHA